MATAYIKAKRRYAVTVAGGEAVLVQAANLQPKELPFLPSPNTKLVFVSVERLKLWLRADASAAGGTAGVTQVVAGKNYRPYSLIPTDVHGGGFVGGSLIAQQMISNAWWHAPAVPDVLLQLLRVLERSGCLPAMVAFDDADPHLYALGSYLFTRLGIRLVGSSLELPLLYRDDHDMLSTRLAEAMVDDSPHFATAVWQIRASRLVSVAEPARGLLADSELLRALYAGAAAFWRSGATKACRAKLGVLVPGFAWRLGVPTGWSLEPHAGGFMIDEYVTPDAPAACPISRSLDATSLKRLPS